jgi:hypothetical protein
MSDGGKGSRPRPLGVDKKTFDDNWDRIFKKPETDTVTEDPNVDSGPNYFQDILSTEDTLLEVLEEMIKKDST